MKNHKFELNKMEKHMEIAILFGVPNSKTYKSIQYPISLKVVNKDHIQDIINKIKSKHLKKGEEILNTNLKELGITI